MFRSTMARWGFFAVFLLPLSGLAATEDSHFIAPTEVFVSESSNGDYRLGRPLPSQNKGKQWEFRLFNQDRDLWTEHAWRSRLASENELSVGTKVLYIFTRGQDQNRVYLPSRSKQESREGRWEIAKIADLLDIDRGYVTAFSPNDTKIRIALTNLRIPIPYSSGPTAVTPAPAAQPVAQPKPAIAPTPAPEPVAAAPAKKAAPPTPQPEPLTAEKVVEVGIEYMMSEYALDIVTYTKCGMDLAQKKEPANFELAKMEFLKVFPKDVRKKIDQELMGPDMVELKRQLDERGIMKSIKDAEKSGTLSCDKGNRKLIQGNLDAKKRWLEIKRQL